MPRYHLRKLPVSHSCCSLRFEARLMVGKDQADLATRVKVGKNAGVQAAAQVLNEQLLFLSLK